MTYSSELISSELISVKELIEYVQLRGLLKERIQT